MHLFKIFRVNLLRSGHGITSPFCFIETRFRLLSLVPVAVIICFLTACGGGGGGDDSNATDNNTDNDSGANDTQTDNSGLDETGSGSFTISVSDSQGVGFNDLTAVEPVGGNSGTTLGEQRLAVVEKAARIWSDALHIDINVEVDIHFEELECSATEGVVGAANPTEVNRGFPGAPSPDVWYVSALANNLAVQDLNPDNYDISAVFNSRVGQTDCLGGSDFYYGFDGNNSNKQIDLLHIVLHELGHGLGFISVIDLETGALFFETMDAFTQNIVNADHIFYAQLDDAARSDSITSLALWGGDNVALAMETLSFGSVTNESGTAVPMYTPAVVESGSSLSHWDTSLLPEELMQPSTPQQGIHLLSALDMGAMVDIGWTLLQGADQDADGTTNADELAAGTDPRRANILISTGSHF